LATESYLMTKLIAPRAFHVPQPRLVVPSRKFTTPVGSTVPAPVMVAVTVTAVPELEKRFGGKSQNQVHGDPITNPANILQNCM